MHNKQKNNKSHQYVVTVVLNYEEEGKNSQRISKILPFIGRWNWEEVSGPSEINDWENYSNDCFSSLIC